MLPFPKCQAKCENDHYDLKRGKNRNEEKEELPQKPQQMHWERTKWVKYVEKLEEKKICRRNVKKRGKFSTKELILWRLKKFRFLLPNFFPHHVRSKSCHLFCFDYYVQRPAKSEKQLHAF